MKKTFIMIFLLISLVSFSANKYIWLHGLEGEKGPNIWDIYQQMLTATNGYILEYPSNNSISAIASILYLNHLKPIEQHDSFILIGHSMGGLVARSMQRLSPHVKAIITIGTPNSGSTLLQNTLNGKIYDFFSNAMKNANKAIDVSLVSGIFSGIPVTTIAAPIILPISIFKNITLNKTLQLLKVTYQSGIGIYALSHPCIRDMLPGSKYLTDLNSKQTTVPHINIYGAENNWQVVRAMGSLNRIAEVKSPDNIDKSYDQEFIPQIQAGLAFIYQIQSAHNLVYNALAVPAIFMPWIWLTRELVLKARFEWDALSRYLDVGMHADFATNMGAIEYRLQNYCIPIGLDLRKLTCKQMYLPYILENDGILSKKDVVSSLQTGNNLYHVQVVGVNHQEMGNHIEIRKLLDGIINLKTYGDVFAK